MPQEEPRKNQPEQGLPPDFDISNVSFSMEKRMRNMQKLIGQQQCKSEIEINALLKKYYADNKAPEWTPETPLDKAQDLIYSAYETADKRKRVKMAREALKICPDCADAYVILAEASGNLKEACALYQAGVKAGERALGERAFKEDVGHFWDIIENRPYMRARMGLAQCLWRLEEREEAIQHYQEMLRLNPDDDQGVRDWLTQALLETGKVAEARKLLDQYKDEHSTYWLYNRALVAYFQGKNSLLARKLLIKAFDANPYVPIYLLKVKSFPRKPPPTCNPGHEDEAIWYLAGFGIHWVKIETDAVFWLGEVLSDQLAEYTKLLNSRKILKPLLKVFLEESPPVQARGKAAKVPAAFVKAFESEDKSR